jgi:hypothetical protein
MSGLIFIIVLFVIVCGFGCYTADHYGQDDFAFDRFADDHPFLAIIHGGSATLLVISVFIGVMWCVSQVLSPEPSTEPPPKHPTTILTAPDGSKTVKVTVGSKISGMPNVKEVRIELTVDSVAAKDVHYTQDIIKDVIKKINR